MSASSSKNKNVFTGFSPVVYPRPAYISVASHLKMMTKEIVFQSGFIGTCLTLLVFPLYQMLLESLRAHVPYEVSDKMLFTVVFNGTHIIAYSFWNFLFGCCDYFGYWERFKLARKPYMQPNKQLIVQTLVQAAIGQIIINPLLTYYYLYDVFKSFGMSDAGAPLPAPSEMFLVYCAANVFNSFFFYWAHRIFHSSLLYATFHKQHHEYRGTMGISAEHAGLMETILANGLPTIGGAMLCGTHPLCVCIALYLRLQQTYEAHSGYSFDGTLLDTLWLCHPAATIHHDYHHTVNSGNFGVEWMDWLFGTQDCYMAAGGLEGYLAKKKVDKESKVSFGSK